eukprot:scaffold9159_cov67-Skeletonema_marinoi.AAC.2
MKTHDALFRRPRSQKDWTARFVSFCVDRSMFRASARLCKDEDEKGAALVDAYLPLAPRQG